jgi:hypothetical protein
MFGKGWTRWALVSASAIFCGLDVANFLRNLAMATSSSRWPRQVVEMRRVGKIFAEEKRGAFAPRKSKGPWAGTLSVCVFSGLPLCAAAARRPASRRKATAANQAVVDVGRNIDILPIFSTFWPHPH